MNLMPFDLTKWKAGQHDGVYTRSERRVMHLQEWPEVLGELKLVGLIDGSTTPDNWDIAGLLGLGKEHPYDLMLRVPEPKLVERWLPIKPDEISRWGYASREVACQISYTWNDFVLRVLYDPATGKGTIEKVEP